jgi:hypothetical protein
MINIFKKEKIINLFDNISLILVLIFWKITGYRKHDENAWKSLWRKIIGQRKITVWKCKNDKGIFEHNHFEEYHLDNKFPTPKFPNQKSWLNKEWKYEHTYLTKQNVIVRKY